MQSFIATDHTGARLQVPYPSGKTLLCFFTKDRTPCCGRERQALCDKLRVLAQGGVQVVGVTIDQIQDHTAFSAACSVSYPMLQDRDCRLGSAFGVVRSRSYKGKSYQSVAPNAFLLDPSGRVERVFTNFDLEHQALSVLELVR
ncbi:MAG: redoxin domain-containing protein [Candidatus Andersenbacteria bacterium]